MPAAPPCSARVSALLCFYCSLVEGVRSAFVESRSRGSRAMGALGERFPPHPPGWHREHRCGTAHSARILLLFLDFRVIAGSGSALLTEAAL